MSSRPHRFALVAVVASLAMLAAGPGRAGGRYSPWIDLHGEAGSDHLGGAELFAPLWQHESGFLFTHLSGSYDDDSEARGSAGLGYRHRMGDWLIGGYGYFDLLQTEHDNLFLQGSAGVEAMYEDWGVRLNAYVPEMREERIAPYRLRVVGNGMDGQAIRFRDERERALPGGDFELGWRTSPLFWDCEDLELRVFGGAYYYDAGGYDMLLGPRFRMELRLYEVPFLPQGSRLVTGGEVRWDDARKTWGVATLRLRIPFNFFGHGGEKLEGLDRRMVDRPVRYGVTSHTRHTDRLAFGPNGQPAGNLAFADGTTEGDARSVPTAGEIETAIAEAGENGVIVALDQTGPIDPVNDNETIALLPGQTVMGGGSSIVFTNGSLIGTYTAPGGPGTFSTTDEIAHFDLADDNWVQSIDVNGGYVGFFVTGDDVTLFDVGIDGIASTTAVLSETTGVFWAGDRGWMEQVSIGDVSSVNTDLGTTGVTWFGDDGFLADVTIGNVSSVGSIVSAQVVSALNWVGDNAMVQNVTAGNISSTWDEVRALWISSENGVFDNITIGNATSTNDLARGIHVLNFNDGNNDLTGITVGNVTGGEFADGIFWSQGTGTWSDITIGNVTSNTNSANGLFRSEGIGGSIDGLTIGTVTGSAVSDVGSAAGIRLSFSDEGTYSNFSIGNVTSTTSGFGFGIVAMNGQDNVFEDGGIGNVSATGANNVAAGVRLDSETDDRVERVTIGDVTLVDAGIGSAQGARGIDEFGSLRSIFDDVTVGNVTAGGTNTNAWGIAWAGSDGMATDVTIGGVTASGAGSFAYGVDVTGNGSGIDGVTLNDVSGPDTASTNVIRVSGNATFGDMNTIDNVAVTNTVTGNGVFFDDGPALDNVGASNTATLDGGGVDCVDSGNTYTGSAIDFNGSTCP